MHDKISRYEYYNLASGGWISSQVMGRARGSYHMLVNKLRIKFDKDYF